MILIIYYNNIIIEMKWNVALLPVTRKEKKGKTNYTIEKKRKKEKKTGLVIITIPVWIIRQATVHGIPWFFSTVDGK
jgi:hypothetical protein